KWIVAGAVIGLAVLFFVFDLGQYLSLAYLKSRQEWLVDIYARHTLWTIGAYMLIYIMVTALSLPGAAVMTLAGGALFGLVTGTVVISFASTIGATLAFLVSRFLLKNWVQDRFKDKLHAINQGIERDGAFYLFTLRLVPVFPFFIINLVMGLTPIRTIRFYLVSQVGMLPGTLVYVNAGTQLAQIDSLKGILSPGLLLSFALLGIFPLLARKGVAFINRKRKGTHHEPV
ncbi:MAG: TVP38/TMEM64 family protein, partial [Thermodesulfobacteriota bacterium]